MMSGVTVAICCHNSEGEIVRTLDHLAQQEVENEIPWEVLLVDNASSDNTVRVAKERWVLLNEPVPLRIIHEATLGLTHARKTSIIQAGYEFVLLLDDDVWLAPNYVQNGYKLMTRNQNIGILSGWGEPVFGIETLPTWLTENIRYSCNDKPDYEGVSPRKAIVLMGAFVQKNMFVNLYKAGFNTIQEGRRGNAMSGGEDLEMSLMVSLLGYDIWESPQLFYQHFIPENRIDKHHLEKMSIGNGKAVAYEIPYAWILQKNTSSSLKNNVVYYALSAVWRYLKHKMSGGYHNQLKAIEYSSVLAELV